MASGWTKHASAERWRRVWFDYFNREGREGGEVVSQGKMWTSLIVLEARLGANSPPLNVWTNVIKKMREGFYTPT